MIHMKQNFCNGKITTLIHFNPNCAVLKVQVEGLKKGGLGGLKTMQPSLCLKSSDAVVLELFTLSPLSAVSTRFLQQQCKVVEELKSLQEASVTGQVGREAR